MVMKFGFTGVRKKKELISSLQQETS